MPCIQHHRSIELILVLLRIGELIFPAEYPGLDTEMLGSGLFATLHPDPGESRVYEKIARSKSVGLFRRGERFVETPKGEIDFCSGMPGFE